jgi:putative ABC transport system permease protein
MSNLLADLRFGLRLLRQAPAFTTVAVVALALGIGANTAIFSTVDAVLLRPLPFHNPDRLVMVWEDASYASFPKNTPASGNFFEWKARNRVFTDMAATRGGSANLTADGPPEQVLGRGVTPNFFAVLGVRPLAGRTFTEEEERTGAPVAIISYGLWQRRYAGDPATVGRRILVNGASYSIIGIMPRDFAFRGRDLDLWTPANFQPAAMTNRGSHFLNVVARLKPGVTLAQAREDMRRVASELAAQYPDTNARVGAVVFPVREEMIGKTDVELYVLLGAAGCILLIACANLAGLLLARAVARRREMAIRGALGAGRGRLIRQLIAEGALLSLAGGVLGVLAAPVGMKVLADLVPANLPSTVVPALDLRVLLFALALSVTTGLAFSMVPAWQATRVSLADALKQGGRGGIGGRGAATRDALVVLEVAAALALLVGAGLMLRTVSGLRAVDTGFRSDHLLTMRTSLPSARYREPGKRLSFYNRVIEGVRALPGVESAAYASTLPFLSIGNTNGYEVEGRKQPPGEAGDALLRVATHDYLNVLGVRLLEGRSFSAADSAGAPPVAVINETLARVYFPKESALGHRITLRGKEPLWRTIVGVVRDVRERGYELEMKPGVYLPFAQNQDTWAVPENLVVRTAADPASLTSAVRRVIASADAEQPVAAVRTMETIMALGLEDRRQHMTLLVAFAGLAVLLASIGLYGVLAYSVTQRTREIGLRMALGAAASRVVAAFVLRGLALATAGVVLGLAAAWVLSRTMTNLLYGVTATDPATYAAVAGLLGVVAAAASWIPARRAARVDPITVLREE